MKPQDFYPEPEKRRAEDADIQAVMNMAAAQTEPSEELMRRLRTKAHQAYVGRRANPKWRSFLAIGGTVAAVAAVTALTLTPTRAMAKSITLVQNAIAQAKTFQLTIHSDEGDKPQDFTVAYVDGRFTMKMGQGGLMKIDAKSIQIYNPEENTVTDMNFGGMVDMRDAMGEVQKGMSEAMKEMDLRKMLSDFRAKYGDDHIHVSPVQTVDGRQIYYVTLDSPEDSSQITLTVDASNDLPDRVQIRKPGKDGQLQKDADITVKFNGPVDPELLNAEFPANAKHVEFNLRDLMKQFSNGVKLNGDFAGGKGHVNLNFGDFAKAFTDGAKTQTP